MLVHCQKLSFAVCCLHFDGWLRIARLGSFYTRTSCLCNWPFYGWLHLIFELMCSCCLLQWQVVPDGSRTPQKDSNFVSKAMEYMFGWWIGIQKITLYYKTLPVFNKWTIILLSIIIMVSIYHKIMLVSREVIICSYESIRCSSTICQEMYIQILFIQCTAGIQTTGKCCTITSCIVVWRVVMSGLFSLFYNWLDFNL